LDDDEDDDEEESGGAAAGPPAARFCYWSRRTPAICWRAFFGLFCFMPARYF